MIDATRLTSFTLTDQEIALADRKRAQADRERSRAKVLAEMGVTPAEAALFNVIHYGLTKSSPDLASSAASPDYSVTGPATREECQAAVAACLVKGWLQVIDEVALARIADELRVGRFLGPIYGLPGVGGVDFTHAGADVWQQLYHRSFPDRVPPDFTDVVHCKTKRYARTRAATLAAIPEEDLDHAGTITGPKPIGPWRLQWWRRFPEGYRIDIEERMQWQGRSGGGGASWVMGRYHRGSDPLRLRHVLDCHDVMLAEWLLMAALDCSFRPAVPADLPRSAAEYAKDFFAVTATEEECLAGLNSCLRNGWLRVVDQDAVDEVHALLRADPVFLPVPDAAEIRQGEIDFTKCGADLYRTIAAEWLGPDWEDALDIWNDYYREEHRYCVAEERLQTIVQGYEADREVVRAKKIVPIGPWCVYWWQRFPSGYRLEFQIGEP